MCRARATASSIEPKTRRPYIVSSTNSYVPFTLTNEISRNYRIDTTAGPGENLSIPPIKPTAAKCKHPQVRVVARDEDTEFVECQQCGEVFDAIEYRDMMQEEEELKKAAEESA